MILVIFSLIPADHECQDENALMKSTKIVVHQFEVAERVWFGLVKLLRY